MIRRPPRSTLFHYTTRSRSERAGRPSLRELRMTTPPEPANARKPRPTRHRGPVMLRGGEPDPRLQGTTTDARLLDRRGPTDWVHTDPWRVLRIQSEFVEGFGLLAELPRAVRSEEHTSELQSRQYLV